MCRNMSVDTKNKHARGARPAAHGMCGGRESQAKKG